MNYSRAQNLNKWFKDFCCTIITSDTEFLPQTYTGEGEIALCSAVCCREGGRKTRKTCPSYFRTITQLSLHTLHTAVTESVQGGERLRAFVQKHTFSWNVLFLTRGKDVWDNIKKMRRYNRGQIHVTEWTMSGFDIDICPHVCLFPPPSQVQVLITDENDCVPEFLQSIYSVDGVPETVTTATSLLQGETLTPKAKREKKKPQTKPLFHYYYW